MKIRTLILAGLLGAAMASQGSVITVPTGLNIGDQYRLVFVTSTTRDATSTDIADYNAFVNTAAALNSNLAGISWTAIASTAAVDARDNTSTTGAGTGIGIYTLDGVQIATSYTDLWDGGLANPLWITEQGVVRDVSVWTGSSYTGGTFTTSELGAANGTVEYGQSRRTDAETVTNSRYWMARLNTANTASQSLYAISEVLTVLPPQGMVIRLY